MTQIEKGTAIPIVHTVELLDWATGGPMPEALANCRHPRRSALGSSPPADLRMNPARIQTRAGEARAP